MLSERRIHPRVNVDLPATLSTVDGESLEVQLINLSINGLLLEGGQELLALKPGRDSTIEFSLHYQLNALKVNSLCRVVYRQRLSQRKHRLGVKILSMDQAAMTEVEQFINQSLK